MKIINSKPHLTLSMSLCTFWQKLLHRKRIMELGLKHILLFFSGFVMHSFLVKQNKYTKHSFSPVQCKWNACLSNNLLHFTYALLTTDSYRLWCNGSIEEEKTTPKLPFYSRQELFCWIISWCSVNVNGNAVQGVTNVTLTEILCLKTFLVLIMYFRNHKSLSGNFDPSLQSFGCAL